MEELELAVHIGNRQQGVSVTGDTVEETRENLKQLFSGVYLGLVVCNDREHNDNEK